MLDVVLNQIIEKWRNEELELVLPYSEKEVRESFNKIGKPVSRDVIQVYTTIGGMTFLDSNLLEFWTLEKLVDENSFPRQPDNLTFFGDFLVFSHLYGYKYEDENVSSVYNNFETGEFLKISESVEDFFRFYLTNPIEIGLYKE